MNSTSFSISSSRHRGIIFTFSAFLFCLPAQLLAKKESNLDKAYGYRFEFLTFKVDQDEKTLLEVFAQIPTQNLTYVQTRDGFEANYSISVNLYNQMGLFVGSKIYKDSPKLQNLDQPLFSTSHIVRFPFLIEPGEHKAVVYVTDLENFESLVFSKMLNIPDYNTSELQLSHIQISSSMKPATKESAFVKNNWELLPNVSNIFGKDLNTLYIYTEIYNLKLPLKESGLRLKSVFSIKSIGGEIVKSLETVNLKFLSTNVLVAQIPIRELRQGQYQLTLDVTDLDTGESVGQSAHFVVVEPFLVSGAEPRSRRSP